MSFPYILYPDSCPVKWRDQHNVVHRDVHPNDDYDDETWRNEGRAISGLSKSGTDLHGASPNEY